MLQELFFRCAMQLRRLRPASLLTEVSEREYGMLFLIEGLGREMAKGERPLRISDIAQELHVSVPAASRMLSRLEERGLIARREHPGDKRNVEIILSPEGRRVLGEAKTRFDAYARRVEERMGAETLLQLMTSMEQLLQVAKEEMEAMGKEGKVDEQAV